MPEVDTDLLKVVSHLGIIQEPAVGRADGEVEDPEEEEVPPDPLVDASLPDEQQLDEGPNLASTNIVHVGHCHDDRLSLNVNELPPFGKQFRAKNSLPFSSKVREVLRAEYQLLIFISDL